MINSNTAETEDCGWSVDGNSLVAKGVKNNRISFSGGVPSADSRTISVEAENLFSSFIARPVMSFDVCVALLMREAVTLSDRCSLCGNLVACEPYHVGRIPATSLAKELCKQNHVDLSRGCQPVAHIDWSIGILEFNSTIA